MLNACIITIGNEIIDGSRLDTNSKWIAEKIALHGIISNKIISIGDNQQVISEVIKDTINKYNYIFITGGLGPTHDDITLSSFKEVFDLEQGIDSNYLGELNKMFQSRGIDMPDINRNQAFILEGCSVLANPIGTARGVYYKYLDAKYFIMPGVPHEMHNMMDAIIIPSYLGNKIKQQVQTIRTSGIAESKLSEKIHGTMTKYNNFFSYSFLPSYKGVDFILKAISQNSNIEEATIEFYNDMKPYSFGYGDESLSNFIVNQLSSKDISIALAESCTGGLLSKILTDVSGSSKVFLGSIVAYSNEVKINQLNIPRERLDEHGAVSSEVARDMACNIRDIFKADLGVSITGISGPSTDSSSKNIGLVYIGISFKEVSIVKKFNFNLDREINREITCYTALNIIRRVIDE